MECLRDLILFSNMSQCLVGKIEISHQDLTFEYLSANTELPTKLKKFIVKIIKAEFFWQFRFMFDYFEVSELLKCNQKLINFLNTFLNVGNLKYVKRRGIIYWLYMQSISSLLVPIDTVFIELLNLCILNYESLLIKIWEFYSTRVFVCNKKIFCVELDKCPECELDYFACKCKDKEITQEETIENSVEIINQIKALEPLAEFFDFSEFFDDELCIYLYNPAYLLPNKLKSFPVSTQFLDSLFKMFEVFASFGLFFKTFPEHLIMVTIEQQEISGFKLALVFDQAYKYKRLFISTYTGKYKDDMRDHLNILILKATNSQFTYEDHFDLSAFSSSDLDNTKKIGSGNFSRVFKNTLLSRRVAIKIPKHKKMAKILILNEFNRLKNLSHPNIVEALGLVKFKNKVCLVMPYYKNGSLTRIRKYLSDKDSLQIMKCVALALATVHKHQLVHQDINPSNVLFSRKNKVKVIDFGLCSKEGQSSIFSGFTVMYSDPDQLAENSPRTKADIWSFGMCLYFTLFKQVPFSDHCFWDKKNLEKIYKLIKIDKKRPFMTEDFLTNNQKLAQLMSSCWDENPQSRPSALELVKEIDEILINI